MGVEISTAGALTVGSDPESAGRDAESAAAGRGARSPNVMQPPNPSKRRPIPPARVSHVPARNVVGFKPAFCTSIRAPLSTADRVLFRVCRLFIFDL